MLSSLTREKASGPVEMSKPPGRWVRSIREPGRSLLKLGELMEPTEVRTEPVAAESTWTWSEPPLWVTMKPLATTPSSYSPGTLHTVLPWESIAMRLPPPPLSLWAMMARSAVAPTHVRSAGPGVSLVVPSLPTRALSPEL